MLKWQHGQGQTGWKEQGGTDEGTNSYSYRTIDLAVLRSIPENWLMLTNAKNPQKSTASQGKQGCITSKMFYRVEEEYTEEEDRPGPTCYRSEKTYHSKEW